MERTIILKFIHDRLPTKVRDNRYYSFRTKHCNHCQGEHEDDDHIIRCLSINRSKSRQAWFNNISDYLSEDHTPPTVKNSILFHFHKWIESLDTNETVQADENDRIFKAINQQYNIGWKHFVRGRLSIEWGNIVQSHLEVNNIKNMSAEKWGSGLLFINWKHILKMWRARCEETYGSTSEQIEQSAKSRLLEEIRHIQTSNADLAHSEHSWILTSIEELSEFKSTMLETWLYSAKIIVKANKEKRKQSFNHQSSKQLYSTSVHTKSALKVMGKEDLDPGEVEIPS
jgi:hypothetical protein